MTTAQAGGQCYPSCFPPSEPRGSPVGTHQLLMSPGQEKMGKEGSTGRGVGGGWGWGKMQVPLVHCEGDSSIASPFF